MPARSRPLDRVGVLKVGSPLARNVLVLNPGTSAGAGYFEPRGYLCAQRPQRGEPGKRIPGEPDPVPRRGRVLAEAEIGARDPDRDSRPLRARDAIYGTEFRRRVAGGLVEVPLPLALPGRMVTWSGSLGPCAASAWDHVIALNERHVCRIFSDYARYYTTVNGPIWPLRRMLLSPGVSKLERLGASLHSLKWADFIIDTSGSQLEP